MKKLLLTVWVAFAASLTFSFAQNGALYVNTRANEAFVLAINGRIINAEPLRDLFITSLPAGQHAAEYTVFRPSLPPVTVTQNFSVAASQETSYEIRPSGNSYTLFSTGNKAMGIANHGMHPTFALSMSPGAVFSNGAFSVTMAANSFNPSVNPWNETTGWPDYQAIPNTGPVVTSGDTTCSFPMGYDAFNNAVARIKAKPIESTRLSIAKDIVEQNCFSSMQVKELLAIFALDNSRVELGKIAWHHLNDPKNWSIVYDAFTYGEKIEELKAYTKLHPLSPPSKPVVNNQNPVPAAPVISFTWPAENPSFTSTSPATVNAYISGISSPEQIIYSVNGIASKNFTFNSGTGIFSATENLYKGKNLLVVSATNAGGKSSQSIEITFTPVELPPPPPPVYVQGYTGPIGCEKPMEAAEFGALKESIGNKSFPSEKVKIAQQAVSLSCVSAGQVRELLDLFTFDSDKLTVAKNCWGYCYDYGNYYKVNDAFTFESYVEDLDDYMKANPRKVYVPGTQPAVVYGCENVMSKETFSALKSSIEKTFSSSTKKTVFKQGVQNACVTVSQVKELLGLLSFDSDKLEMAKFCWTRCRDYSNYYQVSDVFMSSFSGEDLDKYMKDNPRK